MSGRLVAALFDRILEFPTENAAKQYAAGVREGVKVSPVKEKGGKYRLRVREIWRRKEG